MANSEKSEYAKKILNLKDSISYHENSIVSKIIVNKGDRSITLFSFDEGQVISSHTAPVDAVVQVIEGEVEIIISGEKFDLKEGDIILMPAGEPHALTAKTKYKMLLTKL